MSEIIDFNRRSFLLSGVSIVAASAAGCVPKIGNEEAKRSLSVLETQAKAFDIVIYGSGLAGISALIRAAKRRNKTVCVIEPYRFFGGAAAAGLTFVDLPRVPGSSAGILGGDTLNTYYAKIGEVSKSASAKFAFEPKVGESVANFFLKKYATLYFENAPIEPRDVVTQTGRWGNEIAGIRTQHGLITGKVFIDASYEGDLMAGAVGRSGYRYGRESIAEFNEPNAGFQYGGTYTPPEFYHLRTAPGYPFIADPRLRLGEGDDRVQNYNFRLPVTRNPRIRIPFRKPEGYNNQMFVTFLQVLAEWKYKTFAHGTGKGDDLGFQAKLHNQKINWNFLDLPNGSVGYADGSWATRREIVDKHYIWQMGLMWCIANDPIAAEYGLADVQADARNVGLCGDEFHDSPYGVGWPSWLYVREGRRLNSIYMMTARDVTAGQNTSKDRAIAKWNYNWDCHYVLGYIPHANPNRVVLEGYSPLSGHPSGIFDIPAEALMPPKSRCTNLVVPVCSGFSHVAWQPQRMETSYGHCGEAAGEIAAMACDTGLPVQDYDYGQLRRRLLEFGSKL